MRIDPLSVPQNVAFLGFSALFPGFFFYHTALGIGLVPPFLGGYFSPVAVIFLPLLLLCHALYFRSLGGRSGIKVDFWFFGYIAFFGAVVAVNIVAGANRSVVEGHVTAMLHLVTAFLVFRHLTFSTLYSRRIAALCLAAMTVLIFYYSVQGFFYLKQSLDSESLATYQGFARSYLVTFLVVLSFSRVAAARLLLYVVCIPAFYLNGARSEFVAVLPAIAAAEFSGARYRALLLVPLVAIGLSVALSSEQLLTILPENRILQLLEISSSTSWQERGIFFASALDTVAEHPLLGSYGSYVFLHGPGSHAHQIISAWVDLGLLGFLYLLTMIVCPTILLARKLFSARGVDPNLMLPFLLLLVTSFLLLTSKGFTYMLIGAALGAYAGADRKGVLPRGG